MIGYTENAIHVHTAEAAHLTLWKEKSGRERVPVNDLRSLH